ncbi:MAG: hypothetical protein HFF01_09510 [Erysipelotrichaceae bacterium]|nr:hypothetical protein [Erysipelotrichaceae bacterium]
MKKAVLGMILIIILCGCQSKIETVTYIDKDIDTFGSEKSINDLKVNDDYKEIDIEEGYQEYTDIITQFKKAEGFYADMYDIYFNEDNLYKTDHSIYSINNYGLDKMEANVSITNLAENNTLNAYIKNGEYYLIQNNEKIHLKWSFNHLLTYESFAFLNIKTNYIKKLYKMNKDDSIFYRFEIDVPDGDSEDFFGKGSGKEGDDNLKNIVIIMKTNLKHEILSSNIYYYYKYNDGDQSLIIQETKFENFKKQLINYPEDMETWPIVNKDSE